MSSEIDNLTEKEIDQLLKPTNYINTKKIENTYKSQELIQPNFNQDIIKSINYQLNLEYYAFLMYTFFSNYCLRKKFYYPNTSKFLNKIALEEHQHINKIYKILNDLDCFQYINLEGIIEYKITEKYIKEATVINLSEIFLSLATVEEIIENNLKKIFQLTDNFYLKNALIKDNFLLEQIEGRLELENFATMCKNLNNDQLFDQIYINKN